MTTKSTYIKSVIAIIVIILLTVLISTKSSPKTSITISLVLISIVFFNFSVRSFSAFKPYFLSPLNFLSGKKRITKDFDFPRELLTAKFEEVLNNEGFLVKTSDVKNGAIFAHSPLSWSTWGENIYIDVKDNGLVDFTSVAVIGIFTFGRNQANFNKLVAAFEESLII